MRPFLCLSFALCCSLFLNPGFSTAKIVVPMIFYCIDVEGGQATLFVSPQGQSLLIDTGWDGNNGRDADRIAAAAKDAGLKKIDYVLITHYHSDHVGGVTQLAARIAIGTFIDHGELRETDNQNTKTGYAAYQKLLATGKYKRISTKPGDVFSVGDMKFTIITSDSKLLEKPLPGAGQPNPFCQEAPNQPPADHSENEFSQGLLMEFGKFRLLDLGDIPFVEEVALTCPINKIGEVDFFIATHHGLFYSNSPALVHGVSPRVAVMENGAKKGASPAAWNIIKSSPGLEALYQLHWSEEGGSDHNSPAAFLANLEGPDMGNYFKIAASWGGDFYVTNSRTGKQDEYRKRRNIAAPDIH